MVFKPQCVTVLLGVVWWASAAWAQVDTPDKPMVPGSQVQLLSTPIPPQESAAANASKSTTSSKPPVTEKSSKATTQFPGDLRSVINAYLESADSKPVEDQAQPAKSGEAEPAPDSNTASEPFNLDAATAAMQNATAAAEQTGAEEGIESAAAEIADTAATPFHILGTEVAPGTSERLSWNPSDDFMGIAAPTAVLVANGVNKGPTLCLAAAVHGDELNGIEIVRDVFYSLDPAELSGVIVAVPIVNLQGFRRNSRYLADRRDLNRYFPGRPNGSAASRIAYSFFEEVIRHCDFLVDLHTGSFGRTNLPQLRANLNHENVAALAEMMGNIIVVQSRGGSGTLRRAAEEAGIPSITMEAGEPHVVQKPIIQQGVRSVNTLIHALEMAKTLSFWEFRTGPVYFKSRWVRSVNGGILFSRIKLGDTVSEGEVMGTVTDPITNMSTDIVSPYHGKVIGMALDQVMYPGYAAYHIGLRTPAETAAKSEPEFEQDAELDDIDPDAGFMNGGTSKNNEEYKAEELFETRMPEESEDE